MQVFNRHVSTRSLTVFAGELLLIFGSVALAASVQNGHDFAANIWKIALVTAICQLCLYYNDFYDLTVVHSNRELVVRLLQAGGAASILLAALYFLLPGLIIGNGIFVSSLFVFLIAILAWRMAFNQLFGRLRLEERVLVVGTGETARKVARQILDQHDFAYRVVGFIDDDASRIGERIVNPGIIGTPADIDRLVAAHQIDRIVVGLADRRGKLPIQELLRAKMSGVRVEDATTTYERVTGKILIDDLRPSWLIFSDGFRVSRVSRLMKRAIDLTLSLLMAVATLPLMALTAALVWIEDGRPIFYRQERVGENGRPFVLSKFRSMRKDAEQGGRPVWAKDGDERVTRVGRFIRTTRLDELPQLWNVLRGDMSFVGPRPERPFFVDELSRQIPFYQQRHAVKPGLTGWAQVKYRYGSSLEDAMEKLRYDLYYIKHLSVFFDLTIVFDTVKVVLFRKGAA
ncbi:MAG TPA: TIGR03013 family XrtA/PEP-CTERM system glycosyltransferase [Vicinamibacterales bacterium]|jgi:sugar transferase (PEP-CTERM system associated)|nr:TIGR03013 family XrtA/PEP-CTERM system glycosyltransferase [Vicinamibacterales bacterium]